MLDKRLLSDFKIFSDVAQEKLEAIARKCEVHVLAPDEEIFLQNQPARHIYGLLKGVVELFIIFTEKVLIKEVDYEESIVVKHEERERPIVVDTIEPGEVFGWSSMVFPQAEWTATARCIKPSEYFSIPADDLRAIFKNDPGLGYLFMERLNGIISHRLHNRTEKLIEGWGEAFESHRI